MKQVRIRKSVKRAEPEPPDTRTPSGRTLPY